ncbi:hypothetical protein PO124_32960 [Bacillus licheniformis]|nr:hypothetical protein [Bacillus licheniformis]
MSRLAAGQYGSPASKREISQSASDVTLPSISPNLRLPCSAALDTRAPNRQKRDRRCRLNRLFLSF